MLEHLGGLTEEELREWVRASIRTGTNTLGQGYQGHVYLYEAGVRQLVVKSAIGRGPMHLIRRAMLRNEYKVYSTLAGFAGIPRCFGMLDGRYLVLEYVHGVPLPRAAIADRDQFFARLLELIQQLHRAGVAHGDLKKRDNVLVVEGCRPCIVDFGVAVVRKQGFAPLNKYLYRLYRRFDLNAWVRLKLDRRTRQLLEEANELYRFTRVERLSRWVKRVYTRSKKRLRRYLALP